MMDAQRRKQKTKPKLPLARSEIQKDEGMKEMGHAEYYVQRATKMMVDPGSGNPAIDDERLDVRPH